MNNLNTLRLPPEKVSDVKPHISMSEFQYLMTLSQEKAQVALLIISQKSEDTEDPQKAAERRLAEIRGCPPLADFRS